MTWTYLLDVYSACEEEEIITYMCYAMIASMSAAFCALSLGITAPYGRYSGNMSGLGEREAFILITKSDLYYIDGYVVI